MIPKFLSRIAQEHEQEDEGPPSTVDAKRNEVVNKVSCQNCGATAKDVGRVGPQRQEVCPKAGSVVRAGLFSVSVCPLHGRPTSEENDCSSATAAAARIGRRIVSALKHTFGKSMRPSNETNQHLQEILGEMRFLNGWREGRVKCNETRYSYWQHMLENEKRQLEDNYSALKGSQHSLSFLHGTYNAGSIAISEDIVNMIEQERQRQHELEQLEIDVRRHEPSLYRKYQTLQRKPGNKDVVLEAIRTSIDHKRIALDKIERLLSLSQPNPSASMEAPDQGVDENPVMMILPTKMPMLTCTPDTPGKRFRFVFPIGAAESTHDLDDTA